MQKPEAVESIIRVDRGQVVTLTITFAGDPDDVFFTYIEPERARPHVDEGYQRRSVTKIARLRSGVYQYIIDTTGFKAGTVEWHFWSEGDYQASRFGKFEVNPAPAKLL